MWTTLKRTIWQGRGVLITAPSVAVLIVLLRIIGLLQSWEWGVFDLYMRLRPLERPDERIAIVGVNEADVHYIGRGYVPDGVYAELLQKLKAMQPRAIGLDIYRDLPFDPGYEKLVEIFESTPNLVAIQKVVGDSDIETVDPPPALQDRQGQVGANDLIVDADNKIRRGLLYVPDRNGNTVFSFGLLLALHYLDAEGIRPEKVEGTENWRLGKSVFSRLQPNSGGYMRADIGGYQILLNYRGPQESFDTVSMSDILEDRVSRDWGRDRLILIGVVGESSNDLFFTPYSGGMLSLPQRMAGVEIHANLTSQIISAALDDRPPFRSWSEPWEWLWILCWSGVGAAMARNLRSVGQLNQFLRNRIAEIVLVGTVLLGSTYGAFLWGWWLPVVPPLLAVVGSAIAVTLYIARSAVEIRKTFGRYLSDSIVANLLESPSGLELGGQRRTITIFTSDLRGFTALSERLPPEEVVKILNFYLGYMADTITQDQGTIDEFMGDGILVLFGAPTAKEDDAQRAVACAVAMQLAMDLVNEQMERWGLPMLEMGIGINTGDVVVGNIGSEKRTKYGVVGSQVNLTYRIESYTTGGEILISESTLKKAGDIVKINGQKEVKPKGVQQPITIYNVGGIGGDYNLFLSKLEEEVFFVLPEEITLRYTILDGKQIGDTQFEGCLARLSAKGAQVRVLSLHEEFARDEQVTLMPSPLNNIKLNLLSDSPLTASEDVYAKVLDKPAETGCFYIRFTSKPPSVAARLDALYKSIEVNPQ